MKSLIVSQRLYDIDKDVWSSENLELLVPMVGKSMGLADPGREPRLAWRYPLFLPAARIETKKHLRKKRFEQSTIKH